MAQYFVAKKLAEYTPSFVRGFDNIDDARQFRNLMTSSEKNNWEYFIVEVIELASCESVGLNISL